MNGVGQGEDQQATADSQQRVEAVGEVDTVDQLQQQPATAQADDAANGEFADEVAEQAPGEAALAAGEHLDQGDGEKHRHGVIAAGFDFQGRGDPLVEAAPSEQGKHRRGIGGADDGTDQQALQQAKVEQPGRGQAGQAGGDHHSHRRQ